jgi:probable rRNA maturation factor
MKPKPRATRSKLTIDVLVDSNLWTKPGKMRSVVRRAIAQAATTQSTSGSELAILLTDDSAIRQLNRLWRGIDAPTNVLSFPAAAKRAADEPSHLGDIVLAYQTIAREARAERKPLAHHVAHLAVHGFLHLVGYGHECDADAEAMEQAERDILHRLAIPDPYRQRTTKAAAKRPVPKTAPRHRKTA